MSCHCIHILHYMFASHVAAWPGIINKAHSTQHSSTHSHTWSGHRQEVRSPCHTQGRQQPAWDASCQGHILHTGMLVAREGNSWGMDRLSPMEGNLFRNGQNHIRYRTKLLNQYRCEGCYMVRKNSGCGLFMVLRYIKEMKKKVCA